MIFNGFVQSADRFADRCAIRSDDLYGFAMLFKRFSINFNVLYNLLTDLLTDLLTRLLIDLLSDLMIYMGLQ